MRTSTGRKLAGLATGIALATGIVAAAAAPAQAYGTNPKPTYHYQKTDNCPGASGCRISDVIDGTYFKKDAGGRAVKIDLRHSGNYVGKVEFHPYSENLYVYNNSPRSKSDNIYVTLTYYDAYEKPRTTLPLKGGRSASTARYDLNYKEGDPIFIKVWDSSSNGKGRDLIASATAIA